MAISKRRQEKIPLEWCEGLANLLGEDQLPYVDEGQRNWPDGSMYIYLIGKLTNHKNISQLWQNNYSYK